jgi:hypothetical protein
VFHFLIIVGCTKKEVKIEILSPAEVFQLDLPIPLEILYFEPKDSKEIGTFYISELTMSTKNEGTIGFKECKEGSRLMQQLAFSEKGISIVGEEPSNAEFNDFVFQNYSEWCGRWHRGLGGRRWRMCTGLDCGAGLAICFQREIPDI